MESLKKRIENAFRTISWYLDYYLFLVIKTFKKEKRLQDINNIIIIDLKYIGDLIIDTALIKAVKNRFPRSKLSFLVLPEMHDVLYKNPNIDEFIIYNNEVLKRLESKRFDLGILLYPGNFKTSLLLKKIANYRIGIRRSGSLESKGFFLNKKTKPTKIWKHKIEDNLDVIKTIGIEAKDKNLELYTTKEAEEHINEILNKNKILKKDFLIVIHAAPQHKSHEWINERFAKLADILIKRYKAKIVFSGAKKDIEFNNSIIKLIENKAINLAGTTIKEFFSLIKRANLVISVDTSAMHVASAFNKPVIALFGAGNPKIWHPYCKDYVVIFKENVHTSCMKHNCYLKGEGYMECMKAIEIEDVINAVDKLNRIY